MRSQTNTIISFVIILRNCCRRKGGVLLWRLRMLRFRHLQRQKNVALIIRAFFLYLIPCHRSRRNAALIIFGTADSVYCIVCGHGQGIGSSSWRSMVCNKPTVITRAVRSSECQLLHSVTKLPLNDYKTLQLRHPTRNTFLNCCLFYYKK